MASTNMRQLKSRLDELVADEVTWVQPSAPNDRHLADEASDRVADVVGMLLSR